MNLVQRMASRLLGPEVERQSREWKIVCTGCDTVNGDFWEAGGIRYKANPRVGPLPGKRCPTRGGTLEGRNMP